MPPGFKSFGHDDLTARCYFRCSRPPDIDEIKIFDKDDQVAKHCPFYRNVYILVIFIKYFISSTLGGREQLK